MPWPTGLCKEFSSLSWQCHSSSVCLPAYQDQMNTSDPSSPGQSPLWNDLLISNAHPMQTSGFRRPGAIEASRRTGGLLKQLREYPGICSSPSLLVSHLFFMDQTSTCCFPHLLSSPRFRSCFQITQKAWWITHQSRCCRVEDLSWPYKP